MNITQQQQPQDRQAIVVQGNVPAFLLKLWKIVEDKSYDYLISWSQNGRTFKVHDQNQFSKELLPKFYKHNNFSSFVRQVNMYGFRKIVDPGSGSLKLGRDQWEFYHQHFQQGQPNELQLVKRKVHHKEESKVSSPQFVNLLQDVERLKTQAETVNSRLDLVKSENELLWREVSDLRERHHNQQNVINKLIQFFVQLVMSKTDISRKRRAIDYPVITGSKVMKQELQPYYNPPNAAFNQYFEDPSYALSPDSDIYDRVTELSPEATTILDEGVQSVLPDTPCAGLTTEECLDNLTTEECIDKLTAESPPITESPFVFPAQFNSNIASLKSAESGTLTTPTISIPDYTPTSSKPKNSSESTPSRSQTLSTPVINMPPVLARQTSFNDRKEITHDVEKISKSIDILQDMLSKKKINIDLHNLELLPAYNDLPTQVSVQDLIRLSQNNKDDEPNRLDGPSFLNNEESTSSDGGQLLPYTSPFSPSQLIDSHYATNDSEISRSEFFDSLQE